MPLELPTGWVIVLNVIGWPVIHLAVGWTFTRLPEGVWSAGWMILEPRPWEGRFLARLVRVKRWKRLLPDAAPWFGGFAKRRLPTGVNADLQRFIAETRRGEAAHWAMLLSAGAFFIWNPPWADAVMVAYALAANLPCIVLQRSNRVRLTSVLRNRPRQLV